MAKHWKSFVKEEETSKKENEEVVDITSLFSPEGKKTGKSLEDVAEFNSNLKSLIDEQKQLEDEMAALTGAKKETNVDKRYQNEIKTIDQKKKEEKTAEAKRQKRKEHHRKQQDDRWTVDVPFKPKPKPKPKSKPKKKETTTTPIISKKKEKGKTDSGFLNNKKAFKPLSNIPKLQKKVKKTLAVVPKKKKLTGIVQVETKIKKGKEVFDDFTKKRKESTIKVPVKNPKTERPKRQEKTHLKNVSKRKIETAIAKKKKPVVSVLDQLKKEKGKPNSFLNNSLQKKKIEAIQPIAKEVSEKIGIFNDATKKVSKVTNTFDTVQKTGNDIQTGIKKITSVVKSPELQSLSKGLSKGIGIVNKIGNKLNKVDQLFNTANKHLEKTKTVTNFFEKKLKAVDFISAKDKNSKDIFDFDFIQKQQTKKEETQGFNVGNKKLHVDFNTIKDIKKGIDTLKNTKKQKDSFSL